MGKKGGSRKKAGNQPSAKPAIGSAAKRRREALKAGKPQPQVQRPKVEEEIPINQCIIYRKPVTPFSRRGLVVAHRTIIEAPFDDGCRRWRHLLCGSSTCVESVVDPLGGPRVARSPLV